MSIVVVVVAVVVVAVVVDIIVVVVVAAVVVAGAVVAVVVESVLLFAPSTSHCNRKMLLSNENEVVSRTSVGHSPGQRGSPWPRSPV